MNLKRVLVVLMTVGMLMTTFLAFAEETQTAAIADTQKLDASYTLALDAINKEDYETAKEYLDICFVYCDVQSNPVMYADLLLKRACINVIEEKNDMALLNLDAALRIQPDLADAYLVLTQIYSVEGDIDQAIANLEKYIELTEDTSLYETVAQLQEVNGNIQAAQEAYDKFAAGAGSELKEAGFQSGLYKMQAGQLEDAIESFTAYVEDEEYAAGAWYNIGVCRMNLGDYTGAADAFSESEKKGGTFEGIYYNRGVCYLMSSEWEKAVSDFKRSIETESYVMDAKYNLAICQMQTGDYEAAVAGFTDLIGDGGKQAETGASGEQTGTTVNDGAYYYRAVCNAALGNLEAALADYTVCIDHGYELGQSYYQRAQIYAAMGDAEKQTSDLENSLKYAK
ncbi:MAG: tetratricopeptide repeat protein [Clostridia bacterium]|nr:tetratricopeptide repeat protein [Clostridia bacterium]